MPSNADISAFSYELAHFVEAQPISRPRRIFYQAKLNTAERGKREAAEPRAQALGI
jgi:hypothetical protein